MALIPEEVLRKVRELEIRSRRAVTEVLSGRYSSVFRGRGIEFSEVRAYEAGDDVRTIDWNVTARFGHPFVKRFVEERELTVVICLDKSGSFSFGSGAAWKAERAAEAAAILAATAIRNQDKVGLVLFTDRVEKYVPPKKGTTHVLRVIREALFFEPASRGTSITAALEHVANVLKRKAVVFLISDFLDAGFERTLSVVARRHDLIAVPVRDRREGELPRAGLLEVVDAETGRPRLIDTSSRAVRDRFEAESRARARRLRELFAKSEVDAIGVMADEPALGPILEFFRVRQARR